MATASARLALVLLLLESALIGALVRASHALHASGLVGDMGFERGMSLFRFPAGDCEGQRLLVLPWSTQQMRGVGSGVHQVAGLGEL
ncbi:hypothetical protein CLOP_g15887 [Closterium sp. NIES-67]|nr:hypothetical protein CLOP_g15887 [Closterium sp. NIES-67]